MQQNNLLEKNEDVTYNDMKKKTKLKQEIERQRRREAFKRSVFMWEGHGQKYQIVFSCFYPNILFTPLFLQILIICLKKVQIAES